jgi:hypothetical protein
MVVDGCARPSVPGHRPTSFPKKRQPKTMPLQNRVAPTGELLALPGRGAMMGNRGILHDAQGRIVRTSAVKRWIACRTSFKNRKLPVMAPDRYTKLFFLDEATALAAGHRPCAECRPDDYRRFRSLWATRFGEPHKVEAIDAALHAQRLDGKLKRTWFGILDDLPDGTYIRFGGKSRIVWGDVLAAWSDRGYVDAIERPLGATVEVLTPSAIVHLFEDGYIPEVHPTLLQVTEERRRGAPLSEGSNQGTP